MNVTDSGSGNMREKLEPTLRKDRATICRLLQERQLGPLREILPDRVILEACREAGVVFRKRLLTPITTVWHMVFAGLWSEHTFQSSAHAMWDVLASLLPESKRDATTEPGSDDWCRARGRVVHGVWKRIFKHVRDWIDERAGDATMWRGHRIVLVDGTTVSMPDTPELTKEYGKPKLKKGTGRFPVARSVILTLAKTASIVCDRLGSYTTGETTFLLDMLPELREGDIIVGDRHYSAGHLYALYRRAGIHFVIRAHASFKVERLKVVRRFGPNDFVAEVLISSRARKADPTLPKTIDVRFIRRIIPIRGRAKAVWLTTSLLDAEAYPADEVFAIFGMRWGVETVIRDIKIGMGAKVLRSESPERIKCEWTARLVAYNLVRAVMLDAALKHDVDPLDICFVGALRSVLMVSPVMASLRAERLPRVYSALLHTVSRRLISKRPGRIEPRAIKRDKHGYEALKISRPEWREKLGLAG